MRRQQPQDALDLAALPDETVFDPAFARVVLNLILLGADGLPRGGVISLLGQSQDVVVRLAGGTRHGRPGRNHSRKEWRPGHRTACRAIECGQHPGGGSRDVGSGKADDPRVLPRIRLALVAPSARVAGGRHAMDQHNAPFPALRIGNGAQARHAMPTTACPGASRPAPGVRCGRGP